MWPQQLHASEVTSSGFRLAWPSLLTADSGYYVLELAPSTDPGATRRQQLPGNATGWAWTGLDPDTDYDVALVPESNVRLLRSQHLRVHTLPGEAGHRAGRARGTGPVGRRGPLPLTGTSRTPHPPTPAQRRPGRSSSSSRTPGHAACA